MTSYRKCAKYFTPGFSTCFCAFYKAFFVFMTVFHEFMKLQSFEWLNKTGITRFF